MWGGGCCECAMPVLYNTPGVPLDVPLYFHLSLLFQLFLRAPTSKMPFWTTRGTLHGITI
eukprot:12911555-Prorocentrum_lima.AAC.1